LRRKRALRKDRPVKSADMRRIKLLLTHMK
jgi:ribosomal protein L35